jgi:sn-glycerol 3-phosphate transport system substrate-binding protein
VDDEGNITLEFWYALGGDSGEAVEELVDQFNTSHPGITVVATYQGDYTTAMAKVYSAITGGAMPNIAQLGAAPLLGSSDAILPMSDFMATDSSFDQSAIRPAFWEYNTAGGVIWSMPFNNSVPILYYNKVLFTAAGLDPELPPQNLDELLAIAQTLTIPGESTGTPTQWGLNTKADTHWYLSTLILQNGGLIINEDETKMLYNSPEAVEMLQLWSDWVNTYQVMPVNQHEESLSDFLAGKLGMLLGSTSQVGSIKDQAPFEVGTAMFPAVGEVHKVPLGGGSLVIFKNDDTRLVDASWEFVKFMVSRDSSIFLTSKTGYIPIYADALDWPEIASLVADNPLRQAALDSLVYAVSIPIFSALGNSDLALQKAVEQVELGVATPQEALDEAKASVDHAIETQFQVTP